MPLALLAITTATAKNVSGTSVYLVPETQSLYEARHIAAERARTEALEASFGSLVSMVSTASIADGVVGFRSTGRSEVCGIWLRDTQRPIQKVYWDDKLETLTIETKVQGQVEELTGGKADIVSVPLREESSNAQPAVEFNDGDRLFLRFRSSEAGYLAVFLMDDVGKVHTALPYRQSGRSTAEIEKGKEYLFFSGESPVSDTYRLRTSRSAEICRLCIVFSTTPFSGSALESFSSSDRANSQNFEDFDRWLLRQRQSDRNTQVVFHDIIIRKTI